ncbi:hypothetical protein FEDK69T_02460 [Flavobacterium enshiense DK69]|uniref:Uncharacterized protein n=1 Tax=Flavobacterium enshiense DK69 TaxID=1107311 RepID=V6SEP1_9FLAO|nr:hypothetical protein [Flavobacterium enshiense]ESU25056.1 hypothetical protein FEDK69T_02460 [Flavobacterium enshiense DK69]KGO96844.1 hypothetical protein Q767_03855 [Flavobacterium enshiense DK69]
MIRATQKLIEYLNLEQDRPDVSVFHSLVNSILKFGTKSDADILLKKFLEAPFDDNNSYFFDVFRKFGDVDFAEKIYDQAIKDNRLLEQADSEILQLLGDLKYEPVKETLAYYVFGDMGSDYYFRAHSALGLLNFDCAEYQVQIKGAIEQCYGKSLIPEFIPALVCKLSDRTSYLEPLYELGNDYASTDCNAGIMLGFSLCGEEGKQYFKKALFNGNWEFFSGGTGNYVFAYKGLKNLNISFAELYSIIREIQDDKKLGYALWVLFGLFELRVKDYENDNIESFMSLYSTFYGQKNRSDFSDLAERGSRLRDLWEYERLFELKLTEEAIVENFSV